MPHLLDAFGGINWCPHYFAGSDLRNYCHHLCVTFLWAALGDFMGTHCPSHSPYSRYRGPATRAVANPDSFTLRWSRAVNSCCGAVISQISVLASTAFMWLRFDLILSVRSNGSQDFITRFNCVLLIHSLFLTYCFSDLQMHVNLLLFFSTWKANYS